MGGFGVDDVRVLAKFGANLEREREDTDERLVVGKSRKRGKVLDVFNIYVEQWGSRCGKTALQRHAKRHESSRQGIQRATAKLASRLFSTLGDGDGH